VKEGNFSNVRREDSGHIMIKKIEYLKDKINEIELNSKNMNIRHFRGATNLELPW
jgi:hypothetical protein